VVIDGLLRGKLVKTVRKMAVLSRDHVYHDRECVCFAKTSVSDKRVDVVVRHVFVLKIHNQTSTTETMRNLLTFSFCHDIMSLYL
jgi:hypothetical protein